ncbi:hypothetical protein SUGI_0214020 [Cryptomeria japonica]|uniref:protein NRT1/ PTR FAMILY 5.10 n=1 Tax=Cryptomeria japonica TaxID=3369 RepID=UPI0024089DDE|nr:protein NRT1/ PTR FAMILY 5.10 [Cryptomeria japonica]GLJ13507.1 hypothetical protein SUGI_0214020 [Cryptomeria japonica]
MEATSSYESPLLTNIAEDGCTDLHGRLVSRKLRGGWKASLLIIGVEVAERFCYNSVYNNLLSYLTNVMHQSAATAAKNVNVWYGVASMLPLVGGYLSDCCLGQYTTIILSSLVYLLGLICLTLAASLTFFIPPPCDKTSFSCPSPTVYQVGFLFISLYLVALAQGGHRPSIQAFGADQLDERDPTERKSKSSFFNWWNFGISIGLLLSGVVIVYIQENVGWGIGFAIPTVAMAIAFSVFMCGTIMYQHKILPSTNPIIRILQVFVAASLKWNVSIDSQGEQNLSVDQGFSETTKLLPTDQFRFLDKATIEINLDHENRTNLDWRLCTVTQVEEAKLVLRLLLIWVSCLMYGVVFAQSSTFFTKQGSTMDRRVIGNLKIAGASMQNFITITVLVLVPVYDQIFVPLARSITGNKRGITLLQRIGVGMFISVISMVVAAVTEMKRLQVAKEYGLIDMPQVTIPLSIFWLLPQYILFGIADVFAVVGLQELFYDQMPETMRSLGIALYLSIFGVGSFLSSFLICIIEELSSRGGGQNWFADNLNKAHLDYYYWLLVALSALFLCIYLIFANCFIYKKEESNVYRDEEIS